MDYEKELRELANGVFNCKLTCKRVRSEPEKGIVPRYFGIYPALDERRKIDAIICGKNPGHMEFGESMWWKLIISEKGDIYEAYNRCVESGLNHPEIYFRLPYEAAKRHELKSVQTPVFYYTNVAKCENENGGITSRTLKKCRDEYLSKEIDILLKSELVNNRTFVFLLGNDAYKFGCIIFEQNGFANIYRKPHPCRGYSLKGIENENHRYSLDWVNV